jgi:hypothetical protein
MRITPAPAQCRPASVAKPASIVAAAATAMGLDSVRGRVRTSAITELSSDRFQADRMYDPTPYRSSAGRFLVDIQTGVAGRYSAPNASPGTVPPGATVQPSSLRSSSGDRPMDPWVVIGEWASDPNVTARQECYYRDFWRTVVERKRSDGVDERLFLDPKSGFPVKLERREPHALFGDVLAEYVWTTWLKAGTAAAPRSAFRLEDGTTDRAWTHSGYALVERDSVANLLAQGSANPASPPSPAAWNVVDTIRVNASTFLLTTPIYTNVVSLQSDTVFIFDAQQDEARARSDSVWIGKLFPGRHPLVLVVTDLAWPHIGGVRFWVANGVPIITHRMSKSFLEDVINRRWTLKPDLLEQRRARTKLNMRVIESPLTLANGRVKLHPIDGVASEGALMGYFPADKFLYAGDYIQKSSFGPLRPGFIRLIYFDEVIAAVRKAGFAPETFAAMHMNTTSWTEALAAPR